MFDETSRVDMGKNGNYRPSKSSRSSQHGDNFAACESEPVLSERDAFAAYVVDQTSSADDFGFGRTLGTGSFSRIRLALLHGDFQADTGIFSVCGVSSSSSRNKPQGPPPRRAGGNGTASLMSTSPATSSSFSLDTARALVSASPDGRVGSTSPRSVVPFAMKILRKSDIVAMKQEKHTISERNVLCLLKQHPFIVSLYRAYQDRKFLYMLLEFVPGGELFTLLRKMGRFTPAM